MEVTEQRRWLRTTVWSLGKVGSMRGCLVSFSKSRMPFPDKSTFSARFDCDEPIREVEREGESGRGKEGTRGRKGREMGMGTVWGMYGLAIKGALRSDVRSAFPTLISCWKAYILSSFHNSVNSLISGKE